MKIHRLAQVTLGLTFLLLIAGSLVHGTGSGLACPDWPLCHGTIFPQMVGGVRFEHTHRLVAGTVAILTFILAIGLWKTHRALGLLAVFLILFQAGLGAATVLLQLPPAVSILHSATSLLFFTLMTVIFWKTRDAGDDYDTITTSSPQRVRLIAAAWFLLYGQMVLGATVRFLGGGLACPDIPFCRGALWPPAEQWLGELHMLHRFGAVAVAALVVLLFFRVRRMTAPDGILKGLVTSALVLVFIQIGLGVASVWSLLSLLPVTAHLAVGALLLAHLTSIWILSR